MWYLQFHFVYDKPFVLFIIDTSLSLSHSPSEWLLIDKKIRKSKIRELLLAPPVGLEPTTLRLTAACSTDWAKEEYFGDPCGNRTHVNGVRGRCLNRLTNGPYLVHHQGLEPGTPWLRVRCSTNWANGAYFQYPENWIKPKEKENRETQWLVSQKGLWSSPRPISTAKLNMLPCLHTQPINLVVFKGPY